MRVLAALLLAGCAAATPTPQARGLMVAPYGLQPVGTDLRIDFGRAEEGVIGPVSRLLGTMPAARGPLPDCGPRISRAEWPGGLVLYFRDGDFAGWAAASGFPATADASVATDGARTTGLTCA
jgi:hypothetical protein